MKGEPPPEWTKRPRAKDGLRERARELRLQGSTYDQIQMELGCSKSSISLWVRDLPRPSAQQSDPNVISLFLRRLDLLEVTRDRPTVRVSIQQGHAQEAQPSYDAKTPGTLTTVA